MNADKLRCLIVDDEPVARKGMEEYVREVPFLELAGTCENAMKAAGVLQSQSVDLMLLDIHMPALTGIEFLKTLSSPPLVIFTTAYSNYALEGYALDVIDYLVKPVPFDRFMKAVQKAYDFHRMKSGVVASPPGDYFFIKSDHKYERVNFRDVLRVEALQNYCILHTAAKRLITYMTLSGLESQLPSSQFIKVHKSHLVSIAHIEAIDGNDIVIGKDRIPISRNLKDEVMEKIMGNNLFKRS